MPPVTRIASESCEGSVFAAVVRIVFGLLLSVLSFSAFKLYDRMECAEKNIVQLQITDAGRGEKLIAINDKLASIERKIDTLVEERAGR